MMFVNRSTSLAMDDMLASMNSYGAGGTSYGVFNNSEDMALNLGFSGFRTWILMTSTSLTLDT